MPMLKIDENRCTNCCYCEMICSFAHTGVIVPNASGIKISQNLEKNEIKVCTQGEGCNFACIQKCPTKAIYKSDGIVLIDREKCIGCGLCVKACPFDAIKMWNKKAWKCDLCSGISDIPLCVKYCTMEAISLSQP